MLVRPAQDRRHVNRPPSGLDDRQDVGSKGVADHQEAIRRDAVPREDRRVHVTRLVADDLDVAEALPQTRALQLGRLVEQIAFGDQHQRIAGGERDRQVRVVDGPRTRGRVAPARTIHEGPNSPPFGLRLRPDSRAFAQD